MMAEICWAFRRPAFKPRCCQLWPRVGGFVDAVADREIRALEAFAAADIDDVRIGGRHRQRADGAGVLIVEDRFPDAPGVGRSSKRRRCWRRCRRRWAGRARRWPPRCARRETARSCASEGRCRVRGRRAARQAPVRPRARRRQQPLAAGRSRVPAAECGCRALLDLLRRQVFDVRGDGPHETGGIAELAVAIAPELILQREHHLAAVGQRLRPGSVGVRHIEAAAAAASCLRRWAALPFPGTCR